MTSAELKDILSADDNQTTALFKDTPDAISLAHRIIGFANDEGGCIIVGVDEKRKVCGISLKSVRESYDKALTHIIGSANVLCEGMSYEHRKVCVIHVGKALKALKYSATPRIVLNPNKPEKGETIIVGHRDNKQPTQSPRETQHRTSTIHQNLSDDSISPCFGVDDLAAAFSDLLDEVSSYRDNVCFIGVFGKWGRGKSFFLKRLKKFCSDCEWECNFDFVTFNAWKYQNIPGIWAHLIHTLKMHKSRLARFKFHLSWSLLISVALFFAGSFGSVRLTLNALYADGNSNAVWEMYGGVLSSIFAIACLVNSFRLYFYNNGLVYSAKQHMGVQFDSEKELVKIIKRWNWLHSSSLKRYLCFRGKAHLRKIVLLVEDIDRCSDERMIELIEALKVVMDNEDVARNMMIIVTLDSDRLISAYKNKVKSKDATDMEATAYALEQMNKIFLTAISLPNISVDDMHGYVESLMGCKFISPLVIGLDTIHDERESLSHHEDEEEADASDASKITSTKTFNIFETKEIIGNILIQGVHNNLYNLTPRQIRILMYRMLLTNNLMTALDIPYSKETLESVIRFSFEGSQRDLLSNTPECKVLQIAIPYSLCHKPKFTPSSE